MTRDDFRHQMRLKGVIDGEDRWLHLRDHIGVNKVWQAIGEKHREHQMFRFAGGWEKKWFIICQCIDKNAEYQTEHFESRTGNDKTIDPIWDNEIRQWINRHTGDTFAAWPGNTIPPPLLQPMNYGMFVLKCLCLILYGDVVYSMVTKSTFLDIQQQ